MGKDRHVASYSQSVRGSSIRIRPVSGQSGRQEVRVKPMPRRPPWWVPTPCIGLLRVRLQPGLRLLTSQSLARVHPSFREDHGVWCSQRNLRKQVTQPARRVRIHSAVPSRIPWSPRRSEFSHPSGGSALYQSCHVRDPIRVSREFLKRLDLSAKLSDKEINRSAPTMDEMTNPPLDPTTHRIVRLLTWPLPD